MLTVWLAAASLSGAIVLAGRPPPASRLRPVGDGAGQTATIAAAAVAVTALVAVHVSAVVVGVAGIGGLTARRVVASRRKARARDDAATATVEVTFALAAELRAGRTPAQALAAVGDLAGPLRPALHSAHQAVVVGADPAAELARAASTVVGAEQLACVAAAWAVAESAGGRVAVVLERLSESMDSEAELRQELDAAMAGPRATMALLAGLPLLGLVLGQSIGAHPLDLLLHRPLGWGLLASAVVLDASGVVVTKAIAVRALRA
jgi:tight adherence protein B